MADDRTTDESPTGQGNAAQARAGLAASIAGKAKEAAGAVLGKDDLTKEGQLQQAQAQAQREANSTEALADAAAEQAAAQLRTQQQRSRAAQSDVASQAGAEQRSAEQRRAEEVSQAEAAAAIQRGVGQAQAQAQATADIQRAAADAAGDLDEAQSRELAAQREHDVLLNRASSAEGQAARAREQADRLAAKTQAP